MLVDLDVVVDVDHMVTVTVSGNEGTSLGSLVRPAGPDELASGGGRGLILLDALAAILADKTLEPAFIAEVLVPPSEADIAREIGRDVDPDAIFRARTALRALMGLHLVEEIELVLELDVDLRVGLVAAGRHIEIMDRERVG